MLDDNVIFQSPLFSLGPYFILIKEVSSSHIFYGMAIPKFLHSVKQILFFHIFMYLFLLKCAFSFSFWLQNFSFPSLSSIVVSSPVSATYFSRYTHADLSLLCLTKTVPLPLLVFLMITSFIYLIY